MLLVHGDADATVPIGASEQVCAAAKKAPVSCKLMPFAGADHLVPYNQFDRVVQVTADWLRERL
jgi:dipeptidyl aminopeptidase/acylaminoacyl peptidase